MHWHQVVFLLPLVPPPPLPSPPFPRHSSTHKSTSNEKQETREGQATRTRLLGFGSLQQRRYSDNSSSCDSRSQGKGMTLPVLSLESPTSTKDDGAPVACKGGPTRAQRLGTYLDGEKPERKAFGDGGAFGSTGARQAGQEVYRLRTSMSDRRHAFIKPCNDTFHARRVASSGSPVHL